jgi:denticleless
MSALTARVSFDTSASSYSIAYSPSDPSRVCSSDELGYVYVIALSDASDMVCMLNAHNNSIFHTGWSGDSAHVLTASGDQTAGVWDVEREVGVSLSKHTGSVKCIKNSPTQPAVFLTAGRDGKLFLWDIRCQGKFSANATVVEPVAELSQRAEPKNRKKKEPPSFTGFEFLPWGSVIVSVQADESEVRVWDLRKAEPVKEANRHKRGRKTFMGKFGPQTYEQESILNNIKSSDRIPGTKIYRDIQKTGHGNSWISCLENMILVSSMNNSLYLYRDFLKIDSEPPVRFFGHKSSFYVKSCFDPNGEFLASGSMDGRLYVWDIKKPESPMVFYTAFEGELSCVDWGNGNELFIASTSDASVVHFWDCEAN